jgi:AraC-like DNA-binding protein
LQQQGPAIRKKTIATRPHAIHQRVKPVQTKIANEKTEPRSDGDSLIGTMIIKRSQASARPDGSYGTIRPELKEREVARIFGQSFWLLVRRFRQRFEKYFCWLLSRSRDGTTALRENKSIFSNGLGFWG